MRLNAVFKAILMSPWILFAFFTTQGALAQAPTAPIAPPPPPSMDDAKAAAQTAKSSADAAVKAAADIPVNGAAVAPGGDKGAGLNPNDPNVAAPPASTMLSNMMEPFDYDARGRRDPFSELIGDKPLDQGTQHGPLLPLQGFQLNELRLTGILWNVRQPKAIFKDPKGGIYVVGPNAKIGPHNGYVAVIREGEIVVVETVEQEGRLVSTAQVVKIAK